MRREIVGRIVEIGNGLCRVIVRSERLARRLADIPDVRVIDETSDNLGWWLVFPDRLRPIIEPVFRRETKTIVTQRRAEPEQMSLLDVFDEHDGDPGGEACETEDEGSERGEDSPGG